MQVKKKKEKQSLSLCTSNASHFTMTHVPALPLSYKYSNPLPILFNSIRSNSKRLANFKMAFPPNSLKLFLISTWLLFTALGLSLTLSTITHFFATHVPLTWNLCLRPPYLFLLLNAIILSIAASSRFRHPTPPPPPAYVTKPPPPPPLSIEEDYYPPAFVDVKPVVVNGMAATEEDGTVTTSTWTPPEKNPPERTLEEVWKAITKGRAEEVKTRSETMKEQRRRNPMVCATTASTLRKKPQELTQDELNRQAEAFIRKVNEEMKLQKQKSLNRWK